MRFLNNSKLVALGVVVALSFCWMSPVLAAEPDNSVALAGVKQGKVVFDINLHSLKPLPVYLMAIKKTYGDLKAVGVKPDFVIAFRGDAVSFVTKKAQALDAKTMTKVAGQIRELKGMGVNFEVCNLAMTLLKVDAANILANVRVVGNTFISLIGYQAQGYGIIPIS